MSVVYVLNIDGEPLMPTTRYAYVRILLKEGKVKVVNKRPFVIQLLYETTNIKQPLNLGIDPGRTNIGLAVTNERGDALYLSNAETRNKEIPKAMEKRRAFRGKRRKCGRRDKRRRRAKTAGSVKAEKFERILPGCNEPIICHDIRNKEAKFNNRTREKGWLTPTARHLLETHLHLIDKVMQILPVTNIILEINKFAFMALDNPNIQKWEYQQGPLFGKASVYDFVAEEQHGRCLFCNKEINHFHHIIPKSQGGSDTADNLAGVCEEHHYLIHTDTKWNKKLKKQKAGLYKKYAALSVLNQIIPFLIERIAFDYDVTAFVTTGYDTHLYRLQRAVTKDHCMDAFCIANSIKDKCGAYNLKPYKIKQFRRQDRQALHKENCKRFYLLDGKKVAVNRHKAIEQKEDSLAEYAANHPENVSRLTIKHNPPQYKDLKRHMPGSKFILKGAEHVLKGSSGRRKGAVDYYVDTNGKRFSARKCIFIKENEGLVYV